jgi:acyl-CoA reductase-like NAD-dependent aldehyde dehydrogenase
MDGGAPLDALRMNPPSLELVGSSPFIVIPSPDVDRTAATPVKARAANNEQDCINAKQFIVHIEVNKQLTSKFA